jgi:hypothetical protein
MMPSLGSSNAWFTTGAVLAAFPFAYCFGVVVAFWIWGGTGLGPVLIIFPSFGAAIMFAVVPVLAARTRFIILALAAILSIAVFVMVRSTIV